MSGFKVCVKGLEKLNISVPILPTFQFLPLLPVPLIYYLRHFYLTPFSTLDYSFPKLVYNKIL